MTFSLNERLQRDTFLLGDFPLCRVLLMNDSRWPWLILVPMRDGIVELTDLTAADRAVFIEEAAEASDFLEGHTGAEKINIAALGNLVRQFHLHVVARVSGDENWPSPVWGFGSPEPYEEGDEWPLIEAARRALKLKHPE